MVQAPSFIVNNPQNCKLAITIQRRTYCIGVNEDEHSSSIGVGILDRATIDWVVPTVLGPKPKPCKLGYWALPLNDVRILVIKKGVAQEDEDCLWFLQVNTEYVRKQTEILKEEVVAWSKGGTGNFDKPVVITGPSGVGKGTLISMLVKEFPSIF
ncbi:hypothetical protein RCOM_1466510 [Ricinus communis]|uniref:Guanylate kinase-like domain-containing protein n=1 Tax=Ricinus communis TaxID=3988 RepID=B9RLF8_RICCO|nr:hypothetical protein RCOM_1466510 [Ricinus communis]